MSASLRFLAMAVVVWAGVRAASLGMIPGADGFTLGRATPVERKVAVAAVPAIVPTEFPAIDGGASMLQPPMMDGGAMPPQFQGQFAGAQLVAGPHSPVAVPFYYYPVGAPPNARFQHASLPAPRRSPLTHIEPVPPPVFYAPIPQLDDWPLSRMASAGMPARRSSTTAGQQSLPPSANAARLDRLQLSAWALLRGRPGPSALATGGTLGGSQAGARLTYNISPLLAATLRSSSPVGGARGGELAAGIRVTPFRSIPISLSAERRHAIGKLGGGRSAFALFAEGGVYQRPIAWGFELDAYAQAGVVGMRRRDLFVDGGYTLTRPLFGRYAAGFGMWGGLQPGLHRIDAGPRLSMRIRNNMRVHLDYRYRVGGNAEPGSGPVVTLAADF
jgi:hypothetical protein